MKKLSAGLLIYKSINNQIEVLLAHPGGPFWARKDLGAWSLPKGEYQEGEDALSAARREFAEEIGQPAPEAEFIDLGEVKLKSGKIIQAWAIAGDLDASKIKSNTMSIEWPPKSGQQTEFSEVDRAEWFDLVKAAQKLNPAQAEFIERLSKKLNVKIAKLAEPPQQSSLF